MRVREAPPSCSLYIRCAVVAAAAAARALYLLLLHTRALLYAVCLISIATTYTFALVPTQPVPIFGVQVGV
jgi:hypothetical protein